MNKHLTETLDAALVLLRSTHNLSVVLEQTKGHSEDLSSLLETAQTLDVLEHVDMPPAPVLEQDRNIFIANIPQLAITPVSPDPFERLKGWIRSIMPLNTNGLPKVRKERRMITSALMRVGLILGLIISFAGGTYAMADNSLPDAPLYGVKLAMEEIQLDLHRDPAQRAAQHLVLAQNRVQEIIRLAQAGAVAGGGTLVRLEEHLNMALKLAAQLGDEGMLGVLNQAYLMLQVQTQELTRTQAQVREPLQEPLGQAIRVLNRIRERVEAGLQDPEGFRWQSQYGTPAEPQQPGGNPDCPDCEPPGDQNQYGPGEPGDQDCPDCEPPGDQNQYGPGEPGGNTECPNCEPQGEQHQHGPGLPGGNPDCPDCEPQGDQHQYGPGEPGDQDCPDCEPPGDQNQYGPGEPGDQDCPDCEPAGDQNQYGGPSQPSDPGGPGGDQNQNGGPSEPSGPGGDQDCTDCNPPGDQNQNGGPSQPSDPGGPAGDQDCTDCEPAGDQNQYGPEPEQPGGDQDCTDCEPAGDQNQNGGPSQPSGPGGN